MSAPRREANALTAAAWRDAARRILVPLVGALIREGVRYEEIGGLLDEAIEEAAGGRYPAGFRPRGRGRARRPPSPALPLSYAAATRLISRWVMERPFAAGGRPRPLPREGRGSFAALAARAGVDVDAALAALRHVGAVQVRRGRVVLLDRAYVPSRGAAEKIDIVGRDAAEFLRVLIRNVYASAGNAMLQRKASYDNIGRAAVARLRASIERDGRRILESVDRRLAAADRDRNPKAPGGARTRLTFGVYVCEEAGAPVAAHAARRGRRTRR